MKPSIIRIVSFAICGVAAFAAPATAGICEFTSQAIYNDAGCASTLTFRWENATGAVTYFHWHPCGNEAPHREYTTDPGIVEPNYSPESNQNSNREFMLNIENGTTYPLRLMGRFIVNLRPPAESITFSAVYIGTGSAWLGGYGSITCDTSDSCIDRCGTFAPAGCFCDELCTMYDDCCPDYHAVCQ